MESEIWEPYDKAREYYAFLVSEGMITCGFQEWFWLGCPTSLEQEEIRRLHLETMHHSSDDSENQLERGE